MKNTMGYGLNSLLDFEPRCDILAHLIVGSEGTLGFVAEAVFRTIPRLQHAAHRPAGLPRPARPPTRPLPALVETGAATIELMDARRCGWARRSSGPPPSCAT